MMATMPPDDAAVEMASDTDFRSLGLTQREGYVLTRAGVGKLSVRDLVSATGLPDDEAREAIRGLIEKGALRLDSPSRAPPPAAAPAPTTVPDSGPVRISYDDVVFSPADLAEPCDLSLEQKKRILYVEMHLATRSYYALLGLKRTAEQADIKRGYFKASKEFHPDAYFRKNLGSYKGRVERIFRAMKQAYDVLSDAEARKKYDDTLGMDLSPEEVAELEARAEAQRREELAAREVQERDARMQQRLKERRLKRNPMLDRVKKARELMELAERASFGGRLVEAARHAKLAKEYAPADEEVARRADPIIRDGGRERARELVKRAQRLLDDGDVSEARDLADEAADLCAREGATLAQVARVLLRCGVTQRALRHAQAATEVSPRLADGWAVLYELCEREAKWHMALRAAEQLVELRPGDKAAKERLKQARRLVK